jgi:hypothetical protein
MKKKLRGGFIVSLFLETRVQISVLVDFSELEIKIVMTLHKQSGNYNWPAWDAQRLCSKKCLLCNF